MKKVKQCIADMINNMSKDKLYHMLVGLTAYVFLISTTNMHFATGYLIVIAIAMELVDKYARKGHCDYMDVVYTVLIPCLAYIIYILKYVLAKVF